MLTVDAMAEHKYEAHCECGASWWLFAPADPEPDEIECLACGATVVDLRDLGEHHSAGRDVAPLVRG
jgi:hypothetical protein